MKKAAIYTIVSENYGNRLQNYALQKVLTDQGFQVETLRRDKMSVKKSLLKLLQPITEQKKSTSFRIFDKNINWSTEYVSKEHIPEKIDEKYDYFFIGSDQIWNQNFYFSSANDFLPFVPKEKNIAVSASFGVDEFDPVYDKVISDGLQNIKMISVREEAGALLVKKYADRDSLVLIDPTMMLDKEEWAEVAIPLKKSSYILTYFLGGCDEVRNKQLEQLANEKGYQIIRLFDLKDKEVYTSGPGEFIDLFMNAELVCTDSFHACVFSILFDKPFIAYSRLGSGSEMNSRIVTLLEKFQLMNRLEKNLKTEDVYMHDYKDAYKILNDERQKFHRFLDAAVS